jgi:hypothetical protein
VGRFNLSLPVRQLTTSRFGGLFTEADPRDLPTGASWLSQDVDFTIAGVDIRPGLCSAATFTGFPGNFQYTKTALLGNQYVNLAQDTGGSLWQQSLSAGGPFVPFYEGILNNARALSFSANFREYICLSNLLQGTDQPRQFDGQNNDRISQMGPGVSPTITVLSGAANPGTPILSIVTGGSLPSRYEYVVIAYLTTAGVLIPSVEASIFIPAGSLLQVASPPTASGMSGWNVYVGFSSGSETQQGGTIALGTSYTEPDGGITSGGSGAPTTDVAAGDRYGCLMYITRSGFLTPASPPVKFTTNADTTQLQLDNLCIGPSNVLQRVFAWTPANAAIGGPYFYVAVATIDPNKNLASSSIIADNATTGGVVLNISDTVLEAGVQVATTGNNVFTTRELGEPVKGIQYSGRTFFMGCRSKLDTFVNTTFDGGYAGANPVSGWTIASQTGVTQELLPSPIFGFSYYFKNGTNQSINSFNGSSNTLPPNNITQGASLTAFNTPVLTQGLSYGVRATVWTPGGNSTGEVWIGFSSASSNGIWAAKIPCSELTESPKEFILPVNPPVLPLGALDFPTPPVTVPTGQAVAWALPTKASTPNPSITGGNAVCGADSYTNTAQAAAGGFGKLTMEGSNSLNNAEQVVSAQFGGFTLPVLPSDAVIQAIYPVFVCTGAVSYASTLLIQNYENGALVTAPAAGTLPNGYGTYIGSPSSNPTQFTSSNGTSPVSLGATAQVVEDALISLGLYQTLNGCNNSDVINILFAGLAIYYTTSNAPAEPAYSPAVTGWDIIPSDLQLFVAPVNFPAGADFEVDRIEIFDWNHPVLSSQVVVSYAGNPESFDGVTGVLDISNFTTDPIQNIFRFLNQVYICTQSRWFATQDNGTTEPSGLNGEWTINEVSNTVGALGPISEDVGEEYVVCADLRGVWLFDGGSHIKLSQEIQQVWATLSNEYQSGVWVINDRYQQRLLIGFPMPQPSPWTILPAATPTGNNVILMCSYLTLAPGSEIATTPGVTVSMFTGQLLNREGARKWAVWSIPANYAAWMLTSTFGEILWLSSASKSAIYYLDASNLTDDGAAIPQYWGSYDYSDKMDDEQLQLGSVRKLFPYLSVLMDVDGKFQLTIFPETTLTPYAIKLPALSGQNPALDDTNLPLNVSGNRVFLLFGTDGEAGSRFRLRRLVMGCMMHPRVPVSGRLP